MKKLVLGIFVVALAVASCKSDDDGGNAQNCSTCTTTAGGTSTDIEYCDNGDGTYTATAAGTSTTQTLGGLTFSAFIAAIETSPSISCN